MMNAIVHNIEVVYKTVPRRVSAPAGNAKVKCDICGAHVRSSRGLSNHLRQNVKCRQLQSDITSQVAPLSALEKDPESPTHKTTALPKTSSSSSSSAESTTLSENNGNNNSNNYSNGNNNGNSNNNNNSNSNSNAMSIEDPTTTMEDPTKATDSSPGLLQSAIPNDAPGDGTQHQDVDISYTTVEEWWNSRKRTGYEISEPSPDYIASQLMAVHQGMHSSCGHKIPVTNADHGFICASQLMTAHALQQPVIPMGFEAPFVREPMPPPPMDQASTPTDQVLPPTPQSLPPTPQSQGPEPHEGFNSDNHRAHSIRNNILVGGQPPYPIHGTVPSRDTMLYFFRTGQYDPNRGPFSSAENIRPPPQTLPPSSFPESIPTPSEPATSVAPATVPEGMGGPAVPVSQNPATTTNPPSYQSMQVPMAAPGVVNAHHANGLGSRLPTDLGGAAMCLRRNRLPKPNAPSIILLIQQSTCPLCKRDKPLPGERDMKSHIRSELPYRTTEGQVLMLRGHDSELPLAFTIDGRGYRNGILPCPFCRRRVQVVCGSHTHPTSPGNCSTCKSFLASGVAHIGSHLPQLKNPREYVPGHHDTCKMDQSRQGCTCIPHYWSV